MKYFMIVALLVLISCSKMGDEKLDTGIEQGWNVPNEDIVGSLHPFPLIIEPVLSTVGAVVNLSDDAIVAVVYFNDQITIYPLSYVHQYEVINDKIGDVIFAITFCPITQSVICVNRTKKNSILN